MLSWIRQKMKNITANNSTIIMAGGDIVIDENLISELSKSKQGSKLFQKLVNEKIEVCKKSLLDKDIHTFEILINTFFNYGLVELPDEIQMKLQFYKLLLAIYKNDINALNDAADNIEEAYVSEKDFLLNFRKKEFFISAEEFLKHMDETQVIILDILFKYENYDNIKELYENISNESPIYIFSLPYYYGISMFCCQEYEKSIMILESLLSENNNPFLIFFVMMSKLQDCINKVRIGILTKDDLKKQLCELNERKGEFEEAIAMNKVLFNNAELQAELILNLDGFIEKYELLDKSLKEDPANLFLKAQYFEQKNELKKAIKIYQEMDWQSNEIVLYNFMLLNLRMEEYEKVTNCYMELPEENKTAKITGLWLHAIKKQNPEKYVQVLKEKLVQYRNDVIGLLFIGLSIEENKLFRELFIPCLQPNIDKIFDLNDRIKSDYAYILLKHGQGKLCIKILNSINNSIYVTSDIAGEFYRELYKYKIDEIEKNKQILPGDELTKSINIKIEIADWFIQHRILKKYFLEIKINCLSLQKKNISCLACSKELYEETHEEIVAVNIIGLMLQDERISDEEYDYYIDELKDSKIPKSLMAVATAYGHIGNMIEANKYSYKALFVLNGSMDFDLYHNFLALHFKMLYAYNDAEICKERVIGNVVVTLMKNKKHSYNEDEYIDICLDDEQSLEKEICDNNSFGVKHYGKKDLIFIRLQNKKVGECVKLKDDYIITEIIDKYVYAFRYVLKKLDENPEQAKFVSVHMESGINYTSEQVIQKLQDGFKEFTRKFGGNELKEFSSEKPTLIELYYSDDNGMTLPIDTLVQGDYDKYIDIIRRLLLGSNEALYAGITYSDYVLMSEKIVVSISTLVILCQMKLLSLLETFREKIIIPESVVDFILTRIKNARESQVISPGKILELENGNTCMIPYDSSINEMWYEIYECVQSFQVEYVENQERMEIKLFENIEAELLISSFNIDKSQLDCLIVAKKTNSTLLCDDFFFRQIADFMHIENVNLTYLIYNLQDKEKAFQIALSLSETNYIYSPFIYRSMKEVNQIWGNLLNSIKKKKHYEPIFRSIIANAMDNVLDWESN